MNATQQVKEIARPIPIASTIRESAATPVTTDEALLQRMAAGDRLAVQVLFARHHVRVYRFVSRLVGNAAVAEELTNEVFLDVWRQAGRFGGRSTVSAWIPASARCKALSTRRRRPDTALAEQGR